MKAKINELGGPIYWAGIKAGKFEIYHNGEISSANRLRGRIVGQFFKDDEFNGKKFRICLLHTVYDDERTIISIRTDTGYFRTFCNYLASAKVKNRHPSLLIFSPSFKEQDGKKIAALFLQDAELLNWYKAFHNKLTQTLPEPIAVQVNGQNVWDWTPITNFYEQFIKDTFPQGWGFDQQQITTASIIQPMAMDDPDDLPF
jgi:hypothetical protein